MNATTPPKAILCDVDGCLIPEGQTPADLDTLAEIARWIRESRDRGGPLVAVCTGRPQAYAEAICRSLDLRDLPSICEHGVWLYDFAQHAWERDPAITDAHLRAVRDAERWVETELAVEGCTLQLGKSAGLTIFHDSVEHLHDSVLPRLEQEASRRGWPLRLSMTWTCINADLTHVSKASGIRRFMAKTGLKRGELAGIGDTSSDLAIREEVAFFACPANAADELKPHADFIAEAPEAEGVLEILRRFGA